MKNISQRCLIAFASITYVDLACAIDLQPGEIRAPKAGLNIVQLSYQVSERGNKYTYGDKQAGEPEIHAAQFQVRVGRSFEIADSPALFYVQTPMGYTHPDGALSKIPSAREGDSGVGDTSFLLAIWPYANREKKTYFALGAYLTLPTGSYSNDRRFAFQNMGQNRYSSALQTGYQAPIVGALSWQGAIDAVWFGDNNDRGPTHATYSQKVLYTGQTGLRYDFNSSYAVGATYFYTTGGETSLNGVNQDDVTRLRRYQLTGIANYAFGRITLQYGGDIKTENGFIEDSRWILRYTKPF
ncbi:MAG: transporter [Methylotenera sp.]|nr:transporter [Methylotenera sp.]